MFGGGFYNPYGYGFFHQDFTTTEHTHTLILCGSRSWMFPSPTVVQAADGTVTTVPSPAPWYFFLLLLVFIQLDHGWSLPGQNNAYSSGLHSLFLFYHSFFSL